MMTRTDNAVRVRLSGCQTVRLRDRLSLPLSQLHLLAHSYSSGDEGLDGPLGLLPAILLHDMTEISMRRSGNWQMEQMILVEGVVSYCWLCW